MTATSRYTVTQDHYLNRIQQHAQIENNHSGSFKQVPMAKYGSINNNSVEVGQDGSGSFKQLKAITDQRSSFQFGYSSKKKNKNYN